MAERPVINLPLGSQGEGVTPAHDASSVPFFPPAPLSSEKLNPETPKPVLSYTLNVDASCYPRGMVFSPGEEADRQRLITEFQQQYPSINAVSRVRRHLISAIDKKEPGLHHGVESQYALGDTPIIGEKEGALEVSLEGWTRTKYMYGRILGGREGKPIPQYAQGTGTDIVWLTTEEDGSHKLVLLLRHEGNGNYGGTGGIVAGGWDIKRLDSSGKQILGYTHTPPTMESARENIFHETTEEACVPPERLENAEITFLGISTDNVLDGHKGILAMGVLPVSSKEITQWQQPVLDKQIGVTYDFSDPAVFFDATPDVIKRILTQDKTVITPETKATLHLVGKRLLYEHAIADRKSPEEASHAAKVWEHELLPAIKQAETSIDQQVATHYQQYPEAKKDIHWVKPARRGKYMPPYDVKGQGLYTARKGFNRTFGTQYI